MTAEEVSGGVRRRGLGVTRDGRVKCQKRIGLRTVIFILAG